MRDNIIEFVKAVEGSYSLGYAPPHEHGPAEDSVVAKVVSDLGISRRTYYRRFKRAVKDGWKPPWEGVYKKDFTVPNLPSGDMSPEDLVDHVTRRFEQRREASDSRKWIPLRFHREGPVGISFLGDPHVDDNSCDWVTLRDHLEIINRTDGLYAASLGDASNNWVGRLSRLWASQETSGKQAWQLVRWLLEATDWCFLVKGNHDMWLPNDADPIEWLKVPGTLTQEWQARIEVKFPKGRSAKIWASHDFPGHSQWNPLHAQVKRGRFTQDADLLISGHRHHWALAQYEDEWTNRVYWAARAKGYKTSDPYAERLGHGDQVFGSAITAIMDPLAEKDINFMVCFADVAEAAEYLEWKRAKRT